MEAKVFQCSCKSDFQDKMYGNGYRLFNQTGKGSSIDGYRCTVCGKEIKPSEGKKK